MDKPTAKLTKTCPLDSSHTKSQSSTDNCDIAARDLNDRTPALKCNRSVDSWFSRNHAVKALTADWKGSPNWKSDDTSLNLEELVAIEANCIGRLTGREV
jgi:hypothetical protein